MRRRIEDFPRAWKFSAGVERQRLQGAGHLERMRGLRRLSRGLLQLRERLEDYRLSQQLQKL